MSAKEEVGVVGYLEVIVRDKRGRVKRRIGGPPPGIRKPLIKRLAEKVKGLLGDPPLGTEWVGALPAGVAPETGILRNIITDAGIAEMVRLVFGLGGAAFGYIAIGTGTTAESATDTALQAEIKRKAATKTQTTTTVTNDTCLLTATFSSADGLTGTSAVTEAGVFNASTGGVLLARKTFSAVNVNWDAGDSLTINYYIQLSR
jgi:hypothetical protein